MQLQKFFYVIELKNIFHITLTPLMITRCCLFRCNLLATVWNWEDLQ